MTDEEKKISGKRIVIKQGNNEVYIDFDEGEDISIENKSREKRLELEKKKSVIKNILRCHLDEGIDISLDVRDMVVSNNGKYLITCSEISGEEIPRVCIWSLENILAREKNPKACFIEAQQEPKNYWQKNDKESNWILSVDTDIINTESGHRWIICAGTLAGDVFLWSGEVQKDTDEWILDTPLFRNLTKSREDRKPVFLVKIIKEKLKEGSEDTEEEKEKFHVFMVLNSIYGKDREANILNLSLTFEELINESVPLKPILFGAHNDNILALDCFGKKGEEIKEDEKFLICGSRDNKIIKWDLNSKKKTEFVAHEDSVTSVKLFHKGKKLASGSSNNVIRVWDLQKNINFEVPLQYMHTDEIVYLDILKGDKFLVSASLDNTIKVWDLDNEGALVRNIIIDEELELLRQNEMEKEEKIHQEEHFQLESSWGHLKKIIITPNYQYILALKKNEVLIIRNFGRIWHFCRQLKYIEKDSKDLYDKILGDNLRQIARWESESEETLKDLFSTIKERLTSKFKVLDKKSEKLYDLYELGKMFIPSIIRYEDNKDQQKQYIKSVQSNYDNYWFSANQMFVQLLEYQWSFQLYLTTDIEEEIEATVENGKKKGAKFIDLTSSKRENKVHKIILRDRNQSQVRFLMVLGNVPATFIPLLKAVILDVEDDRGDKDSLIFTDFIYPKEKKDSILILDDPEKSIKNPEIHKYLENSYYSECIFKLDERYSTDKLAKVFIKKVSLEFTESLNPLKSSNALPKDIRLFEAFRDKFTPTDFKNIEIKIGKGFRSAGGKIIDLYLGQLITLDFLFTIISVLIVFNDLVKDQYLFTPIGLSLFALNVLVSALVIITFFWIFIKKQIKNRKYKKMGGTDVPPR